jgi:hypothetical protein
MARRSALLLGSLLLAGSLAGCATPAGGAGAAGPDAIGEPSATNEPATVSDGEAAAARAQAQAWLDSALLPPEAVRSDASINGFISYTGWPCGPVEELEGFWTIPGAKVRDTANWLIEHPPAGLMTTAVGPVSDDPMVDSAIVGFIPQPDAQEGIVYTIDKAADGVVVRAEVAAMTESAVCPTPPGGGTWGAPGQG